MPESSNVLDEAKDLIEARLAELNDERKRLERALADITGSRRGPGRPRGSRSARSGSGKGRRRRKGGTRAEHALKAVGDSPGATAGEIAKKLGIKPNYMYRVMGELEKDGKVRKQGRGYHPA